MIGFTKYFEMKAKLAALEKSQTAIEFNLDGTILTANKKFLEAFDYTLDKIKGNYHRIFVYSQEQNSTEYWEFWEALRRGEHQTAEYRRFGKDGREVWIQATYNPILDPAGRPLKIVKLATDVTAQIRERLRRAAIQQEVDASLGDVTGAISDTNAQTAKATEEISSQIAAVQAATGEVVDAIDGISGIVTQINEISATIALSVEEQDAVTRAMATNMNAAAQGAGHVSVSMNEIASAIRVANDSTGKVKAMSRSLLA